MKNKVLYILMMVIVSSFSYSQLNITTDLRKDLEWNTKTESWDEVSSNNEITYFEFEDTVQDKMGIFIHRTNDITSAYLIKSHSYNDNYDWDEFEIVSDVGNKYTMFVKISDDESDDFIWFSYEDEDDNWRAVQHRIKSITNLDKNNNESEEVDLYDGNFSFKEYFDKRINNLDPIEGIWSLNVERTLYFYDSIIHKDYEEMRSEWAIAYNNETKFKVYGLEKEADFSAFFEKTAVEGFYNYSCDFTNPDWKAKANVILETENSILKYGYFVSDIFVRQMMKEDYVDGMRYRWDFTWIKKYPLNTYNKKDDKDFIKNEDWTSGGTGFFIDRKGYFATNYHVVSKSNIIQIEFYRDGELQTYNAEIIKEDKINDLAILKISDEDFKYFDEIPYNFSTRVADIGEEVFALGYPLTNYMGKDIKFTDGKISSKTGYDGDIANYQTTTPIQPGNSGGPLFDYNGNLIGINASRLTFENTQNVSYSIKSSYLKNLIDVLPIQINLPSNKDIQDLKLTEKIKIVSDFVVLIKVR